MTSDSEWGSAFSQLESAGVHIGPLSKYHLGSLHPCQSHRCRSCESIHRFRELFDCKSELQPRVRHFHFGCRRCRPLEHNPVQRYLRWSATGGEQSPHQQLQPLRLRSPPTSTGSACYPKDNEGTCYEPGQYCRDDDHGATGRARNGDPITCDYKNGWHWEPT